MLDAIRDLFLFRAFRPHVNDVSVPLSKRFAGRSCIGFSWGRVGIKTCLMTFDKRGFLTVSDVEHHAPRANYEVEVLKAAYTRYRVSDVAVLMGWDYSLEPSDKVRQVSDLEMLSLIRSEPHRLIGKVAEPAYMYAVVYNPMPTARWHMVWQFLGSTLKSAEELVRRTGGNLVRLHAGVPAVLRYLVDTRGAKLFESDLLVVDHNFICIIHANRGEWEKDKAFFRCDPGEFFAAFKVLAQRSVRPNVPLHVVNTGKLDIKDMLNRMLPDLQVTFEEKQDIDFVALGHL